MRQPQPPPAAVTYSVTIGPASRMHVALPAKSTPQCCGGSGGHEILRQGSSSHRPVAGTHVSPDGQVMPVHLEADTQFPVAGLQTNVGSQVTFQQASVSHSPVVLLQRCPGRQVAVQSLMQLPVSRSHTSFSAHLPGGHLSTSQTPGLPVQTWPGSHGMRES